MKNSVSYEIVKYLESTGSWTFGGSIEDHIRGLMGAKASNASRRCRELEEDGRLEKQFVKVEGKGPKVVQYRLKPTLSKLQSVMEELHEQPKYTLGQLSFI